MSRFAIIIPCHNAAAHLTEAIRSVQDQSFIDWSMILVDDGSTDETFAICEAEAARDQRITAVRQENAGPSAARNRGAAIARSKFLAFLDADDLWSNNRLSLLDDFFRSDNAADAAYTSVSFFKRDPAQIATTSRPVDGAVTPLDCLRANPTCTSSNIIVSRTAFLATGGFDENLRHSEDLEWLVRLCNRHRLVFAPGGSVFYRTSTDGLSSDLEAMRKGWNAAARSAEALGLPANARRDAEAAHLRYLARRALRLDGSDALRLAMAGCRTSPAGFFGSPSRGAATFVAALAAPLMPRSVRRALFA